MVRRSFGGLGNLGKGGTSQDWRFRIKDIGHIRIRNFLQLLGLPATNGERFLVDKYREQNEN